MNNKCKTPQKHSKIQDHHCEPRRRNNSTKKLTDIELVIFDKDGTLICFHSMWVPWIRQLVSRLEDITGLSLVDKISEAVGYCTQTNKVLPGILAEGTIQHSKNAIKDILIDFGHKEHESKQILNNAWREGHHKQNLKPVGNPKQLFQNLKSHGIKIGVCTADNRQSTESTLNELHLLQYIDILVCGDDPDNVPKPAPDNAHRICKKLNVRPENSVMVGDSKADIGMGRSANLGLTVGVLSGVAKKEDLFHHGADYVLNDVEGLNHLLLNKVK